MKNNRMKKFIFSILVVSVFLANPNTLKANESKTFESNKVAKESEFSLIVKASTISKEEIKEIISKLPNLEDKTTIEKLIEKEEKQKLSNREIAKLVINGDYGNGEKRRQALEEEGRDPEKVQKEVDKIKEKEAKEKALENKVDPKQSAKSTPKTKTTSSESVKASSGSVTGKSMTMEATGYSTAQPELSRYTADGTDLHQNPMVIAVDPSVIPLGSKVTIEGYGTYTAADTGGAIKGNRIDIHFTTVKAALDFGRRNVKITVH